MKHKIAIGAFNKTRLLALNAKASVAPSLAPNLQMSLMYVIFFPKMVQQNNMIMAKLVELGHVTVLCSPKVGIIIKMQNEVPK